MTSIATWLKLMSPTSKVFVDTSAFYALLDRDDANHKMAIALFKEAVEKGWQLITSNFVVAETHALILHRLGRQAAMAWLKAIPAQVIGVTAKDEEEAKKIIQEYSDKEFSYCDATSFALMERNSITTAFTMDKHFAQYGKFVIHAK